MIGAILRASLCSILTMVLPAVAQEATDEKMAEEALLPYVRQQDSTARNARLDAYRTEVQTAASRAPEQLRSATIVFSTGVNPIDAVELLRARGQTLLQIGLKAPVGSTGVVNSVSIGAMDLLRFDGDMATQVQNAIGLARGRMLNIAKALEAEEAEDYRKMALGPLAVYSLESFGTARDFEILSRVNIVRTVVLDPDDSRFRGYPWGEERAGFER